jgi:hypothetical protein
MSALEQNFNPSNADITKKTNNGKLFLLKKFFFLVIWCSEIFLLLPFFSITGYPRLLSGDLSSKNLITIDKTKQACHFPETEEEESWKNTSTVKRYYLSFPFYPFRTLCPRDFNLQFFSSSSSSSSSPSRINDFDNTSPMFPANTQINIVFNKRNRTNFLQYMLPYALDVNLGSKKSVLTDEQKKLATSFSVESKGSKVPQEITHIIKRVDIKIKDLYLQIYRIKYKGISPERPLANVFSSYRSVFTPLQKVSLHQYDLSWESTAQPSAVYIGFVK